MTDPELFTAPEKEFLKNHSICRFASIEANGWPHNVPVGYTFNGEFFYISTEYSTKKLRNVRQDPKVALVVDEPGKPRKGVSVQGEASVLEKGSDFQNALQKIVSQHGEKWGFKEGEQAILKVKTLKKFSWGI